MSIVIVYMKYNLIYIYIYILAYSICTRKGNKYGSQISCHNRAIHLVTTKTVNEKEKKKKKQSI